MISVCWNPLILQRRKIYKLDNSNGRNCAQLLLNLLVLDISYLTQFKCITTTLEVGNVMDGSWAISYIIILQLTEYLLAYPLTVERVDDSIKCTQNLSHFSHIDYSRVMYFKSQPSASKLSKLFEC